MSSTADGFAKTADALRGTIAAHADLLSSSPAQFCNYLLDACGSDHRPLVELMLAVGPIVRTRLGTQEQRMPWEARRAPLVTVVLPPLVIAAAQNILFSRSDVWQFLLRRLAPIGSPAETLASPELWLGLVAAIALLAVVIRLRRYRDDT